VPPSGIGQAVTFFEKTLKKVANSPNPLWQALGVIFYWSMNDSQSLQEMQITNSSTGNKSW
jgi:hypothetical protein